MIPDPNAGSEQNSGHDAQITNRDCSRFGMFAKGLDTPRHHHQRLGTQIQADHDRTEVGQVNGEATQGQPMLIACLGKNDLRECDLAAKGSPRNRLSRKPNMDSETASTHTSSMNPRLFTFVGGLYGPWAVTQCKAVSGPPLPMVERLDLLNGTKTGPPNEARWMLRGVVSNERYVSRSEKEQLVAKQIALGSSRATQAALIPIKKNAEWWALTPDERRTIFEERSHHTETGLKYLPGIARRLHHCRDLGENEPFDFLTFFDYAEADAAAFEDLVASLRATEEWKFVERETDIRLVRDQN